MKYRFVSVIATWLAWGFLTLGASPKMQAQKTAREVPQNGIPTPLWTNSPGFHQDVFTFLRVKYSVDGSHGYGHTLDRWKIDFPDSDLNFSFRLQQMTSMKVDPDGRCLELTETNLTDFPFIYVVEPGRLTFSKEEIPVLKRYLLNGGFMMFDDFWGDREWKNFTNEVHAVFPDRPIVDLPIEHPIFHCVFDLKEKPQVPGYEWGVASEFTGITYEKKHDPGAKEVHYRAVLDDKGRIMMLICHNTDLGDGWERESDDAYFFKEFVEKKGYPMGINIIVYAMTH